MKHEVKHEIFEFSPLLLLYVFLIIRFTSATFQGDESDYASYASRLAQPNQAAAGQISLWRGPGYPIVLAPFVVLNSPWLAAKLLNALLLFGAVIYFNRTLNLYIARRYATLFSLFFGLFPPLLREIPLLLTETLVVFLVCGFTLHFCSALREPGNSWFHVLAASIYLGYLALTKIFFGYVILAGLFMFVVLFVWRRTDKLKRTTYIYFMAFVWCTPYLLYTYSVTGKSIYWGTSGGMSLYWMSTSYSSNEWGSWFSPQAVKDLPELTPHRAFFDKIAGLSEVAMDDAFKRQALENIAHHPGKYFINWLANTGRLLFSYPFSYESQKLSTYFYILPNMFIVVLSILSIYPAILRRRTVPYEISASLLFILIAFGGSSLLSAYDRQFLPLTPVLFLWLSIVYVRLLNIQLCTEAGTS